MRSAYAAGRRTRARARILVVLDKEEVAAIDAWAIPADVTNRSEALRTLIRNGLRAAGASTRKIIAT